jgi:hypothetical protein
MEGWEQEEDMEEDSDCSNLSKDRKRKLKEFSLKVMETDVVIEETLDG